MTSHECNVCVFWVVIDPDRSEQGTVVYDSHVFVEMASM